MEVRFLRDVTTYDGRHSKGDVVNLNSRVAEALVRLGSVEEVIHKAPKRETLDKKMGKHIQTEQSVAETAETKGAQNKATTATTATRTTVRPPRTS